MVKQHNCNNLYNLVIVIVQPHDFLRGFHYIISRNSISCKKTLERDINVACKCLQLFWPEAFSLDPFFDRGTRNEIVRYLTFHGKFSREDLEPLVEADLLPKDIFN